MYMYELCVQFLQPTFPGSLRQVARNAFNLVGAGGFHGYVVVGRAPHSQVFCFDPASPEGVELTEYIALFLDNLVPVRSAYTTSFPLPPSSPNQHIAVVLRLGVILVSATDEEEEVGAVMTRGFYYIAEHYSGRQALMWLLQVYRYCSNSVLMYSICILSSQIIGAEQHECRGCYSCHGNRVS